MNSPAASIIPTLLQLAQKYGQQPGQPGGPESDAASQNNAQPTLLQAAAADQTPTTDSTVPDRTEDDKASTRAGGAAPPDRMAQLQSLYDKASQPIQRPTLKQSLIRYGVAAAPAALIPLAGRHGNWGAAEGAAKGVGGGVKDLANTDEANRRAATQRQFTRQGQLLTDMEQERRSQVQEHGMDERAKQAQLAETGRNNRLLETIQGQNQRAAGVQEGQDRRTTQGINAKADLANKAREQQLQEFRTTDQYRRWKEQLDSQTKIKTAAMSANKAPAAMLQSAEFAQGGLRSLNDAQLAMQRLEQSGAMGSLPANKIEDWIFGKGLVDPTLPPEVRRDIGQLRSAFTLTSSATMRAHTGRSSKEIYDDFKQMLGPGQDWNALKGATQEVDGMLQQYANMGSNEEIGRLRGGGITGGGAGGSRPAGGGGGGAAQNARPTAPPKVGDVVDGYRYKGGHPGDQNSWEKVPNAPAPGPRQPQ